MPKLVLVDEISTFLIRYVVEIADDDPTDFAQDTVVMGDASLTEFSQKHLFAIPSSARVIDQEEYLRIFDEDNAYLRAWSDDLKLRNINRSEG